MTIGFSHRTYQDAHSYSGISHIRTFHKLHVCPVVPWLLRSDLCSFLGKIDKWGPLCGFVKLMDWWMSAHMCVRVCQNGTLKIIDRKKHIFKLAQGEYIAPEKIENIYVRSNAVAQVYVHGDSLQVGKNILTRTVPFGFCSFWFLIVISSGATTPGVGDQIKGILNFPDVLAQRFHLAPVLRAWVVAQFWMAVQTLWKWDHLQ